MRQFRVRDPYRKRKVTIWARDKDQEPRYLEIPTGSTVWVSVGQAGPLAAPCEYRQAGLPTYKAMVSLEDLNPQIAPKNERGRKGILANPGVSKSRGYPTTLKEVSP